MMHEVERNWTSRLRLTFADAAFGSCRYPASTTTMDLSLLMGHASPWAFGQTEPIGSVPRSFGQFGHQKPGTDRSLQKTKTEEVRSRLVRFGLGHDRTNRT